MGPLWFWAHWPVGQNWRYPRKGGGLGRPAWCPRWTLRPAGGDSEDMGPNRPILRFLAIVNGVPRVRFGERSGSGPRQAPPFGNPTSKPRRKRPRWRRATSGSDGLQRAQNQLEIHPSYPPGSACDISLRLPANPSKNFETEAKLLANNHNLSCEEPPRRLHCILDCGVLHTTFEVVCELAHSYKHINDFIQQ